MKPRPPVVRVLDASLYTKIAGDLRKSLPGKVIIDIDRSVDADGKKIVLLRCSQTEIARMAIAEVLGEEYQEPEVDEDALPLPRKEFWQRGMDSIIGGYTRDTGELREGMNSYARQFQKDIIATRKTMFERR